MSTLCPFELMLKLASSCTLSNNYLKSNKENEFLMPHREILVQIFQNFLSNCYLKLKSTVEKVYLHSTSIPWCNISAPRTFMG